MAQPKPGEVVNLMREEEITTYPKLGQAVKTMAVTYSTPDLPPRTLWIPKDGYSELKRDQLIRKDIDERRTKGGKIITV